MRPLRALLLLPVTLLLVSTCDSAGDDSGPCWVDEPEFGPADASKSIMKTWGAPCENHQDCVDLIGDPDAICETMAVIFELPGKYCTKACDLPDTETTLIEDAPQCDPNGGINCIGAMGTFTRCAKPCTSDDQCERDGYACRLMPEISAAGDPKYCLMSECCEDSCY